MSNKQEQSVYYVPGAILLAGFIIAGAIYFTNKDNSGNVAANNKANTPAKTAPATGAAPKAISADEHILGNPNAEVKIVEYSDTECPFCKRFHVSMHSVIDSYGKDGKVAWVYRHFPLDSLHKKTRKEAQATECAAELGGNTSFWSMLDKIYTETTSNDGLDPAQLPVFAKAIGLDVTKFNTCLSSGKMASVVDAQYQDGLKAGARGTPYNVIVLNNALSKSAESTITSFISQSGLASNVSISSDKKRVVMSGALPEQVIKTIIDAIIK
jgi:protein-disulfide isomerase